MNEKCEWTHARLSAAHDGVLAGAEKSGVDDHLAGCPECRLVLEEIRLADEFMSSAGPISGPSLVTDDLIGRLHLQLRKEARSVPWWRTLVGRGVALAFAGGLAAVVLVLRSGSVQPVTKLPQVAIAPVPGRVMEITPSPAKTVTPVAPPGPAATSTPVPVVEVAATKSAGSSRMFQEMQKIKQELEGIDRRFSEFQQEARRLAGEHDRQVADRRLPEWK